MTELHEHLRSLGIPETGRLGVGEERNVGYIEKIGAYYGKHCSSTVCGRFLAQRLQYYFLINS